MGPPQASKNETAAQDGPLNGGKKRADSKAAHQISYHGRVPPATWGGTLDRLLDTVGAASLRALDALAQAVIHDNAAGGLSDCDALIAVAAIDTRRKQLLSGAVSRTDGRPPLPRDRYPVHRYQPARRHPERIARRRRIAASGPLPPALAGGLTTSHLSVMAIVAEEVREHGNCTLCLYAIAARAGVCRTTVRTALREAERSGLISREERRRPGRANLTTVVRIISAEWRQWIKHGGRRAKAHRRYLFGSLHEETGVSPTGVKNTSRSDRLRHQSNGQPARSLPDRPSGDLWPSPLATTAASG